MSTETIDISAEPNNFRFETREEHLLKQVLTNQKVLLTTFAKFFDQENDDWTEKECVDMAKMFEKAIQETDEMIKM